MHPSQQAMARDAEPLFFLKLGPFSCSCSLGDVPPPDSLDYVVATDDSEPENEDDAPQPRSGLPFGAALGGSGIGGASCSGGLCDAGPGGSTGNDEDDDEPDMVVHGSTGGSAASGGGSWEKAWKIKLQRASTSVLMDLRDKFA